MRPLSRLLSVFIALILMGTSLAVVSANDALTTDHAAGSEDHVHDLTASPADNSYPTYGARVIISRVDSKSPVYPGDTIKFRVLIIRGNHAIPAHAPDNPSLAGDNGTFLVRTGDEGIVEVASTGPNDAGTHRIDYITGADFPDRNYGTDGSTAGADDLVASAPSFVKVIDYKVRPDDLGPNATSRNAPIQFTLLFDPDLRQVDDNSDGDDNVVTPANVAVGTGDLHAQARVFSNKFNVLVEKKPGTAPGDTGVSIEFTGADPDDKSAGESISFTLIAKTTGKALSNPEVVQITRQRFKSAGSEDEDKDGDAVPVNFLTIPSLHTHSTSAAQKVSYVLLPEDIAAQRVEFSVSVVIDKGDVSPAAGTKDTLKATHTFMAVDPEPEPEPSKYLYENEAAKVMLLAGGTAIDLVREDTGHTITLVLGTLSSTGTLLPQSSGYIRDESRGQTYAVVRRASDNKVVRSWIPATSEWVPHVPWENVIAFYNVPAEVLNVIPLDDTMPEVDQLVAIGEKWYVYRDSAWRHIPNQSTFRANGFYWCDLTTADSSHAAASTTATPLPSRVGPPGDTYPACR